MNALLYTITWFCWGGSWLAIKWQQGNVPVQQSIAYRFAIASVILLVGLIILRRLTATTRRDQLFCLLQGFCLYSMNFVAFYLATHYISSGLVAVVMSTAVLMNTLFARLIWGQTPNRYLRLAAPLGISGLIMLFWQDLSSDQITSDTLIGITYSLTGTLLFSLGNMISIRQARAGLPTLTSNAWGMLYGCLLMALVNTILGDPWIIEISTHYLSGLLYLALIASVLAFPTYLLLVARTSASSAAYVLVATPILALTLSWLFEDYQWTVSGVSGVVVIILGNLLILTPEAITDKVFARFRRRAAQQKLY